MSRAPGQPEADPPSQAAALRNAGRDPTPAAGTPDAVIFDCDGVLVDSEPITNRVLCSMLVELGLDFDLDRTIRTFMGKSVKDEIAAIEGMIGRPLPADWHAQFVVRRDAALAVSIREVPGVRAVIERLVARGIPFAVASGADCAKMQLTLGTCGLLQYFSGRMFGADMVARAKPAPDVYELAISTLGVAAARTVVVEDTPTGTRAGAAAGATVYGLTTLNAPAVLMTAGASATFARMEQLPTLLGLA